MDCKEHPFRTLSSAGILGANGALVGDRLFSGMVLHGRFHHHDSPLLHRYQGFHDHSSCLEPLDLEFSSFRRSLVHDFPAHSTLEMVGFLSDERMHSWVLLHQPFRAHDCNKIVHCPETAVPSSMILQILVVLNQCARLPVTEDMFSHIRQRGTNQRLGQLFLTLCALSLACKVAL